MLKFAKPYEKVLSEKFLGIMEEERYKYYFTNGFHDFDFRLPSDTWNQMDFVSVDTSGEVIGYLSAKLDRAVNSVASIRAVNFSDINYIFSKDFNQFLKDMFIKYKFNKINFNVVAGNPAEKMYDKYIERYGGRVVGTFAEDVCLSDGNYYNLKFYELHKANLTL